MDPTGVLEQGYRFKSCIVVEVLMLVVSLGL